MPSAEAQANALITLLESLHPRWALTPHLSRLEAIVADLKKTQADAPEKGHKDDIHQPSQQPRSIAPSVNFAQKVWDDKTLVCKILEFDGSLGYYYKNYDVFMQYARPSPTPTTASISALLRERMGSKSIPLVNKTCYSLSMGTEGLEQLQKSEKLRLERQVAIAKETKIDASVSWLARVFAMAMTDDARGLEALIKKCTNSKSLACAFGAALKRYYNEDYFELGLPPGHPFEGCAVTDLVELKMEYEYDNPHQALIAELAYNAMRVGAVKTLEMLKRHFGWGLQSLQLDDTGMDFLSKFVQYACSKPYVTHHAQCIRTLLRGEAISTETQYHLPGSAGNILHLAAAKGDIDLVSALLDSGLDPSVKCETGDCGMDDNDERLDGRKELPLPEDWARVRGHTKVEQILKERREMLRPDLRNRFASRAYFNGKLARYFPDTKRQYGFIVPDPGQPGLTGRGSGSVFAHITAFCTNKNTGFPQPGQRLCFSVRRDRRGRQKADIVISADDWSYVNLLQMEQWEADDWWCKYNKDGTESENEEEEEEPLGLEGDENEAGVPAIIALPVLGRKQGYL